jgi:hypothetical protein
MRTSGASAPLSHLTSFGFYNLVFERYGSVAKEKHRIMFEKCVPWLGGEQNC